MAEEGEARREPDERELDRRAWNLPSPVLVPVGPVHEVWPVRDTRVRPDELKEDAAA